MSAFETDASALSMQTVAWSMAASRQAVGNIYYFKANMRFVTIHSFELRDLEIKYSYRLW